MTDRIATAPTRRVPRIVPIFNPIARLLLAARIPMGYNGLITIRGRTSGEPRTTPLAIIAVDGNRWVWSPWGEVHWVRNLRAAGRATITMRGRAEEVRAIELGPTERVAFFRDTMAPIARRIPFGVRFARILDGVDLDHPVETAEGRVVFELQSIG